MSESGSAQAECPPQRPRVVIIGGGFGGIHLAKGLRHAPVDVTLIDRHNYHLFQPLLYQVASGMLDPSEIAHPIRTILRRVHNVNVIMANVRKVDMNARTVETDTGVIEYDHLVVAAGSRSDFFGQLSVEEQSIGLKSLDDGLRLRAAVLESFERASIETNPVARARLLTFAIVGGGPTGIELAGALTELVHHVLPKDYRNLDFSEVRVVVVEAADHILDAFAPKLRRIAERTLRTKGVAFIIGGRVTGMDAEDRLLLADGTVIDAETIVWTAGVEGEVLARDLSEELVRPQRVRVSPELHPYNRDDVWVIGDLAAVDGGSGRPLPMLAPVAIQQGEYVARALMASITGEEPGPFRYRDKGTMATVGRNVAVVQFGRIRMGGFLGWLIWLFVHLLYIVSFRSRLVTLINWGWDYVFYDRPVRLITGAYRRSTKA